MNESNPEKDIGSQQVRVRADDPARQEQYRVAEGAEATKKYRDALIGEYKRAGIEVPENVRNATPPGLRQEPVPPLSREQERAEQRDIFKKAGRPIPNWLLESNEMPVQEEQERGTSPRLEVTPEELRDQSILETLKAGDQLDEEKKLQELFSRLPETVEGSQGEIHTREEIKTNIESAREYARQGLPWDAEQMVRKIPRTKVPGMTGEQGLRGAIRHLLNLTPEQLKQAKRKLMEAYQRPA